MDTIGRLARLLRDERGAAIVHVTVAIIILIAIAGLAIDLGYMYVTKGQLQNASDAAALAGVQKMKPPPFGTGNPNDLVQAVARTEAVTFAGKNYAATQNLAIANDSSNAMSDGNDITVGHWNDSTHTYTPGVTPVNAVQVRGRRTDNSPSGPVNTFLAKVLGWNTLGAESDAIAALPPRAGNYISFCVDACIAGCDYPTICSTEKIMEPAPDPTGTNSQNRFAWSTLLNDPTSASAMNDLVCGGAPSQEVCGQKIYTTMGQANDVLRNMESVMYHPTIDGSNKEKDANGDVTGWWVIVPITASCPPGNQGSWDPKPVVRYALVRIKAICLGGTAGCMGYSAPGGACPKEYKNAIVIDRISCVDCTNKDLLPGTKPVLVE